MTALFRCFSPKGKRDENRAFGGSKRLFHDIVMGVSKTSILAKVKKRLEFAFRQAARMLQLLYIGSRVSVTIFPISTTYVKLIFLFFAPCKEAGL